MPLLLDLADETLADQNRILSRHELLHLDALDRWTKQRLPVYRLRCPCQQGNQCASTTSAISVPQRCWLRYGRNSRQAMRQLTSESFYLHDETGGKSGPDARLEVHPQGRVSGPEALAPFADDLAGCVQSRGNDLLGEAPGGQQDNFGANDIAIR